MKSMRRRKLILVGLLAAVIGCYAGLKWMSLDEPPVVIIDDWNGDVIDDYGKYKDVSLTVADKKVLSTCKKLLISKHVAKREGQIELTAMLIKADKSSSLYFFQVRDRSGPTYVFKVNGSTGAIIEKYLLPDA
ncbi:MAG: hypothetical protein JWR19_2698 [Pedosphaera sp.]|nr:hypothetical protein [Pedosphaera sp.]